MSRIPEQTNGEPTQLYPEVMARGELPDPWRAVHGGFESPDLGARHVPPTFMDRLGTLLGKPRRDPWLRAINNFVEFSPSEALPPPDYQRRGVPASDEERARHAALLPGGCYHQSVWQP